jgi:copper chaperone NosL
MKIVDPKFGGELVTKKGRIYKFDAVECLISYLDQSNDTEYAHVLAIAYDLPQKLFHVNELNFEIDSVYNSPMGMNLAAFGNPENGKGKALMNWESIQKEITASDFQLAAP